MGSQEYLMIIYQLCILIAGLIIASFGRQFLIAGVNLAGKFLGFAAGAWAGWNAIERWYEISHPFASRHLDVLALVAAIVAGLVTLAIVLLATDWPSLDAFHYRKKTSS